MKIWQLEKAEWKVQKSYSLAKTQKWLSFVLDQAVSMKNLSISWTIWLTLTWSFTFWIKYWVMKLSFSFISLFLRWIFFYSPSIFRFKLSVSAFNSIFIDSSLLLIFSVSVFYFRLLRLSWLLISLSYYSNCSTFFLSCISLSSF